MALAGFLMAACAIAPAQENTGDRVVVPARNTTRPRVVNVALTNGAITVKTHAAREVIVETKAGSTRERPERSVDGLRRIDLPPRGLVVEEEDNTITVRSHMPSGNEVTITVPPDTSLQLKSTNGSITVSGVTGDIEANTTNGHVTLDHVSGTVVTDSHNGPVKVVMDRVTAGKPISFSSFNGDIDVTLPADFKANLKLRAARGDIYSDFEIQLQPGQVMTEKSDSPNGKFRVRLDRSIAGTLNGGGTEATFSTYNGKILIRKK
jgi:DUF4097 and DUF4098 domain-containing protein YvlB